MYLTAKTILRKHVEYDVLLRSDGVKATVGIIAGAVARIKNETAVAAFCTTRAGASE